MRPPMWWSRRAVRPVSPLVEEGRQAVSPLVEEGRQARHETPQPHRWLRCEERQRRASKPPRKLVARMLESLVDKGF